MEKKSTGTEEELKGIGIFLSVAAQDEALEAIKGVVGIDGKETDWASPACVYQIYAGVLPGVDAEVIISALEDLEIVSKSSFVLLY